MRGELTEQGILYQQDDIYVLKMTMPFPLRESNVFMAESADGWTVVDTGVNIGENQERWKRALTEIGITFRHIKKIYLTHYHHDHLGLAGWLQEKSGAVVYLPQDDVQMFTAFISTDHYRQAIEDTCLQEGWTYELVDQLTHDIHGIGKLARPYPYLTPLAPQESFHLGEHEYRIVPVPGHSDGHYVFFSPTAGHLFSGDNVVAHTVLHLTDWPHTRLLNPLHLHLQALQQLKKPAIHLVLPGHGPCFGALADRIDLIQTHHQKRKDQILQGLKSCTPAWNLACNIFRDHPYIHVKRLILAETLAYLYALVEENQVAVDRHRGVYYYCRLSF